nr:MAG: putative coat protein [Barnaviridae sp.]
MSLIVSRQTRRGNTVVAPASTAVVLRNTQPRRRAALVPVYTNSVQPPQGGQVSSPRRRRRNRSRNYPVSAPSAFGAVVTNTPISFRGSSGKLIMSHREISLPIVGTTGFSWIRYPLVPPQFAYLKGVARNFSRYRWTSLRATFITSSPTSHSGSVGMGVIYDGLGSIPASLGEVGALSHGWTGPVWAPPGTRMATTTLDCSRWSRPWYSYYDGDVSLEDAVSYIPAYLIFGIQTQVNGQNIGHIEFEYTIELNDPIPASMQTPTTTTSKVSTSKATMSPREDSEPPEDPMQVMLSALVSLMRPTAEMSPPLTREGVPQEG